MADSLKAKMQISIDILGKESFTIDIGNKRAIIGSYDNIVILLEVAPQAQMQFTQQILANKDMTILTKTLRQIFVQSKLPERRDFLFKPSYAKPDVTVFVQIVKCGMTKTLMRNNADIVLTIASKTQLVQVVKYEADACYQAHIDTVGAALLNVHCSTLWDLMAFNSIAKNTSTESDETILDNGITCYRDPDIVNKLEEVIRQFKPSLWTDTKTTMDLSEDQRMDIPLIANWEEKFKAGNAKVYLLRPKDCEIVDTECGQLFCQGRMDWSRPMPFTYPCFVVWTTKADSTRKGRTIMNIRLLNKITLPDAYPMSSQANILADLQEVTHILTVDCSAFFYQWRVKPNQKHQLTMSLHCGQEVFNVAVMGYKNLPA